ncbi:histidine kinase [Mumia flava]|uniref:Histidine kinase n=1 Tax=Mumia flava TaxID=1348852 RepID=A0A2M9BFQ5_9ACTN|nr:GAF domain-containing protein [Mumia flava]PJJ56786.1 histidine kinase [Mumia flava]
MTDEVRPRARHRDGGPRLEADRLRALIRANAAVVEHLDLRSLLHGIIESAVTLVRARYGAIGVIGEDGGIEQFLHVGMPPEDVERIGHLPEGRGLLGALIDDPRPIRLTHITDDERSAGFPAGHPPMDSFLGVPIRVRDDVFGNLYLTDHLDGAFAPEDEELAASLAATAGIAIANARLYEESRYRELWSAATARTTHELLSRSGDESLELIADRVRGLADASLVAVLLPTPDDPTTLTVRHACGDATSGVVGLTVVVEGSLAGTAFRTAAPSLTTAIDESGYDTLLPAGEFGPAMALPLRGRDGVRGAIVVVRTAGARRFTEFDLDVAASFAGQAALALERADAAADRARVELLEDRDRIARDLHDHVIQQLFASGLSLQSIRSTLGPGPSADRVEEQIHALDATIRQIRTTIFELRQDPSAGGGLRAQIMRVAREQGSVLGLEPVVTFRGPVETMVGPDLAGDVLAVVREGLANVGRHTRSRQARLEVMADGAWVTVRVDDDGVTEDATTGAVPEPVPGHGHGLRNLRHRAQAYGGGCELQPLAPHGTRLEWRARTTKEAP